MFRRIREDGIGKYVWVGKRTYRPMPDKRGLFSPFKGASEDNKYLVTVGQSMRALIKTDNTSQFVTDHSVIVNYWGEGSEVIILGSLPNREAWHEWDDD